MTRTIYGIRICPISVEVVNGVDAPIVSHNNVSEECSDLLHIFRALAPAFRGHFVADDFPVSYGLDGHRVDPLPRLREVFGSSLLDADVDSQVMLLKGDDFMQWGEWMYDDGWAFFPIFQEVPSFALLKQIFWGQPRLASESWPASMRALLHLRDGMYWQFFTVDRADVDVLLQAHTNDPKLDMYFVDFDREYPDPSGQELQPATLASKVSAGRPQDPAAQDPDQGTPRGTP
jgi:hypothetical protein